MEYLDDELYDTRENIPCREDSEIYSSSELKGDSRKIKFRPTLYLPQKYYGEKVSSQEYKKYRSELETFESLESGDDSLALNFEIAKSDIDKNIEDKIEISESIYRKIKEYKQIEADFSIVDDTNLKGKLKHDREYGRCVKNQLKIWSDLLAIRIFVQNILKLTNKIFPTELIEYIDSNNINDLYSVRSKILDLLLVNFEIQMSLARKNSKLSFSLTSDTPISSIFEYETRVKKRLHSDMMFWDKYNFVMNNLFEWCIDICDSTKKDTQIHVKKFKILDQPIRTQLERTLINREEILEKSSSNVDFSDFIGADVLKDYFDLSTVKYFNKSIYDDSESFLLLLKSIVLSNSSNEGNVHFMSSLPVEGRKNTNNVDRRASKGRKIRYVPIPKLENFMASSPSFHYNSQPFGNYDEEFINCIMSSLLLA